MSDCGCGEDHDRLLEAVPWVEAVVNACAEAGFGVCVRVYQDGTYSWWPLDPHEPGAGTDPLSPVLAAVTKAMNVCERLRPEWVTLRPLALETFAGGGYSYAFTRLVRPEA